MERPNNVCFGIQISPLLKQIYISSGVLMSLLGGGMLVAFPSSLLPALRNPDSVIKIDLNTGSWLASVFTLTAMLGLVVTSFMMEKFGRRLTFALMLFPNILGWFLIFFAADVTTLMIGRIFGGIWAGSSYMGTVIIAEYTSPEYRGILIALKTTSYCAGNLIMHILGRYYNWRTIALLSSIPAIICLCSCYLWPESPYWLANKCKYKRSEKTFYWLRGFNEKSLKEIEALIQSQKAKNSCLTNLTFSMRTVIFLRNIRKKMFYKPIIIIFVSHVLLDFGGRHFFPSYAPDIIGRIDSSLKTKKYLVTISVDIITMIGTVVNSLVMKAFNRRPVLLFSGILSVLLLGCISLYIFLVSQGIISNLRAWIPTTMFIIYYFFVNLGVSPIPPIIAGEVLPLSLKGSAMGLSGILLFVPLYFCLQVTPIMLETFELHGTLSFYCLGMILALLYIYFMLPETHNKTLQEIENFFEHGSYDFKEAKNDNLENTEMLSKN